MSLSKDIGTMSMSRKVYRKYHPVPKSVKELSAPLHLKLMMLSCEDNPPYGPSENTAGMFLDLIVRARCVAWLGLDKTPDQDPPSLNHSERFNITELDLNTNHIQASVSISVYECKHFDYPATDEEWDNYHGVLLPGSFNSAYDNDKWIEELKDVIREKIHKNAVKTLAVCFGHQVFAHALDGGLAVKCPAGPQAGHREFYLSEFGNILFKFRQNSKLKDRVKLLYTHSDMVEKLPECAQKLGGNQIVPIQSAAYFASTEKMELKLEDVSESNIKVLPYAITFQAHPEYSSNIEFSPTFENVLSAMSDRGLLSDEKMNSSFLCANRESDEIVSDSMDSILSVGFIFGWL